MTIEELRAKGAKAASDAETFYKENLAEWNDEKQAQFDKMVQNSTDAYKEVQKIQAREEQARNIAEQNRYFNQPMNPGIIDPPAPVKENLSENRKKAHREAFNAYIRGGERGLANFAERQELVAPKEIHALLSNDQTLGGFTVPDDWRAEVIKAEAGFAVLANLCRVETTNRDALVFPKLVQHASDERRTSGFTGQFQEQGYVTGGTAPTVQNKPTFAQERIPVNSWQPDAVEVSPELMQDSGANLDGIIQEAIAETLAFDKDDKIFNGTGVGEPEGFMNAGISTINSGGATSIAYGGVVGMYTALPAQYRRNATWIMDSRTMGAVIQLNTGTGGMYLFPPNQWNNEILSHPVVFLDYGMDTATAEGGTTFTANQYPIVFGNFRYYIIAMRQELRVQRLVERYAPNTGFLPTARLGGQVVLTDAFRIMKISA